MPNDPLFIIGTERSGSNLLRVILNAHSRIAVPHPPHLMHWFGELAPAYGDLADDTNLRRLVQDVLGFLDGHIYPWDVAITADQVLARTTPRSLYGVTTALYDLFLADAGKARWGCKSTFMVHHVDTVLAVHPGARFLWLVRDPRDVAASSRKAVFSPFHPVLTTRLWVEQQQEALALEARLPTESLLRLRYEDLLADPNGTLTRVCAFLDEPFEPGMLEFFDTPAARKGAALSESWAQTAQPVQANNSGKYRKDLSPTEVTQVEAVARPVMQTLGYGLEDPDVGPLNTGFSREVGWRAMNAWWHAGVEWRSLRNDSNHWRRWARRLRMTVIGLRLSWRSPWRR